jgi:hypothetical protein
MLDLIHRIYEADESFHALDFMVHTRLYTSQVVIQIVFGTLVPIGLLRWPAREPERACPQDDLLRGGDPDSRRHLRHALERRHRGQLFSKSFLGYTTYKMGFATREGLLPAILLMILPFVILAVLIRLLPPFDAEKGEAAPSGADALLKGRG